MMNEAEQKEQISNEILDAKNELTWAKHRLLKAYGWDYTSLYFATWLWKKTMPDGTVVLVSEETAVGLCGRDVT